MKIKKICLFSVCVLLCFSSFAQQNTVSFNYVNLGKVDNHGWNSGVGTQLKIHLKNHWYILPDAGYLFEKIHTPYNKNDITYKKESHQYLFVNVNVGYFLSLSDNLKLVPHTGTGYYHDFRKILMVSHGGNCQYVDSSMQATRFCGPYHVFDQYFDSIIALNLGFLAECNLTKKIFLTAGYKYMFDIYDKSSYIPYLNLGAGYRF